MSLLNIFCCIKRRYNMKKHYTSFDLTSEISAQINEKWNSLDDSQKWECVRDYTRGDASKWYQDDSDKIKCAETLFDSDVNFGFFILGGMDAADMWDYKPEENADQKKQRQIDRICDRVADKLLPHPIQKPKKFDSHDLSKLYLELERKYNPYPVQMSRADAFQKGLSNGDIDQETYDIARKVYGNLWFYVGD